MDENPTYNVTINNTAYLLTAADVQQADIVVRPSGSINLLHNNQSINATIIYADERAKKLTILLNGEQMEVTIKDNLDLLLDKMGFQSSANKTIKEIKAPMPGLVLEITVNEGDVVNEGDKLLILEAMKMENSIVIPVQATIKKICVKKGQAVEKGQLLIELE